MDHLLHENTCDDVNSQEKIDHCKEVEYCKKTIWKQWNSWNEKRTILRVSVLSVTYLVQTSTFVP